MLRLNPASPTQKIQATAGSGIGITLLSGELLRGDRAGRAVLIRVLHLGPKARAWSCLPSAT